MHPLDARVVGAIITHMQTVVSRLFLSVSVYLQGRLCGGSSPRPPGPSLPEVVQELEETDKVRDERLLFQSRGVGVRREGRERGTGLGQEEVSQLPVPQRLWVHNNIDTSKFKTARKFSALGRATLHCNANGDTCERLRQYREIFCSMSQFLHNIIFL